MSTHVLVAIGWTLAALIASGATPRRADAQGACPSERPFSPTRELRYVVNARVRPLLFWIGRRDVGAGRITWSRAGEIERVELLVGSDPSRAPMHVNRWGYLAETICARGADLAGVMTESQETSVEQASASVSRAAAGAQIFRSISATVGAGRSDATVARVQLTGPLTYLDLPVVLPAVAGASGETRAIAVTSTTAPGFLAAVALLAGRALTTDAPRPRERAAQPYVYNGQLFDLELIAMTRSAGQVDTEFRTRNRARGTTTTFWISWDPAFPLSPRRIRFRPRWWFEAELVLEHHIGHGPTP